MTREYHFYKKRDKTLSDHYEEIFQMLNLSPLEEHVNFFPRTEMEPIALKI